MVSSRTPESVDAAVAALGDQAVGVVADNADPSTPGRLVAAAHERFGRLDGALISVGGPPAGSVLEATDEQWTDAFSTVFVGSLRLARTVAAELDDGGSIAFVLSTSAKMPVGGLAISNGLRPGLAMAAKTMADELGPRGIRVNGLLPGRIETSRVQHLDSLSDDPAGDAGSTRGRHPAAAIRHPCRVRTGRRIRAVAGGVLHHRHHDPGRRRTDARAVSNVAVE